MSPRELKEESAASWIFEESQVSSGFVPRCVLAKPLEGRDAFYVGCEDGSITFLTGLLDGEPGVAAVGGGDRAPSAVSVLYEETPGNLLVGLVNGDIGRVDVEGKRYEAIPEIQGDGMVRAIHPLEKNRLLVVCQHSSFILEAAGQRGENLPGHPRGTRFVQPLEQDGGKVWVFVTERGEIHLWRGDGAEIERCPDPWPQGERPVMLNDYGLIRTDDERRQGEGARGLFLATDSGVYLVTLRPGGTNGVDCQRLALPGLGIMPTASSYAEKDGRGFLWIGDARGDGHLFASTSGEPLHFRRSGVRHTRRETVVCFLWFPKDQDLLLCGQACNKDQVVIGRYMDRNISTNRAALSREARMRRFLSHGHWSGRESEADLRDAVHSLAPRQSEEAEGSPRWSEDHLEDWDQWPAEALLAELFERLGERRDNRTLLIDAIRSRHAPIVSGLLAGERSIDDSVRLWTLALLGVIHRSQGRRELAYVGLMRWLRDRQEDLKDDPEREDLVQRIQENIDFVDTWGWRGKAQRERRDLVHGIDTLARLEGKETDPRRSLERLVYKTLLFNRRVDQIHRHDPPPVRGRTAWRISHLQVPGGLLLAVSWRWGGVEIFEHRHGEGLSEPATVQEEPRPGAEGAEPPREKFGYSRIAHLGRLSDHVFLLWSPTRGPGEVEEIQVLSIVNGQAGDRKGTLALDEGTYRLEQSVYSILEIGDGLFVVGLRGREGYPVIRLLRVELDGEGFRLSFEGDEWSPSGLEARGSQHGSQRRNRVWSLACDAPGDGGLIPLFMGCEGGQIYRVELDPGREPKYWGWSRVAQVGSPVLALLHRRGESGRAERVYAGCEDGSIMAWQAVDGGDGTMFCTLWATREEGSVAGLHRVNFSDRKVEGTDRSGQLILAVIRNRRAVLFDDREAIEESAIGAVPDRPRRAAVPGSRFGRYRLPDPIYASTVLPEETFTQLDPGHGAFCALLTASGDGSLNLSSLHSPSSSGTRKQQYSEILDLSRRIAEDTDREGVNLRLGEALFAAAPSLPWILVRWFLDPVFDPTAGGGRSYYPSPANLHLWLLPRYVRPLAVAHREWERMREKGFRDDEDLDVKVVGNALAAALERAWLLNDIHLYQEMCALALKRANFMVFHSLKEGSPPLPVKRRIANLYTEVYRAIEGSLGRWLGSEKRREARARAVVAKNMVDGDTIWRIATEAARELESGEEERPYYGLVQLRVTGVRELVHKRDPMVSLEALRAANLSLMRLASRLIAVRQASEGGALKYRPGAGLDGGEITWKIFEDYFERLTAAAARSFLAPQELNDALAHEYSRTFALLVTICPSAAIRIANRLTETHLVRDVDSEDDLSVRVRRQLRVLSDIGLPCPHWARLLFRHVTTVPADQVNPMSADSLGENHIDLMGDLKSRYGAENEEDLQSLQRLYRVVGWFISLHGQLSTDARGIDLSRATLKKHKQDLEGDLDDAYKDSRSFWTGIIEELIETLYPKEADEKPLAGADLDNIRPEVVVLSRSVAEWAKRALDRLQRWQNQGKLFVPEADIYRQVLKNLHVAASAFRTSAAVHKNLVGGILGHHLLENLDEHVLELEEIAYSLALLRQPEVTNGSVATARRFANYLLRRGQEAQSIPKNLRVLQTLLTEDISGGDDEHKLEWLLQRHGWKANTSITVRRGTLVSLGLTLEELDQNHAKHSGLDLAPVVEDRSGNDGQDQAIMLKFPFVYSDSEDSNYKRLRLLRDRGLQGTFAPKRYRGVSSTGSGLYLANMAAAVVGWRLRIHEVVEKDPEMGGHASCAFVLEDSGSRDDREGEPA